LEFTKMYGRLKRRASSYIGSQPGNAKYLRKGRIRAAAPRYRRTGFKYRGITSGGSPLVKYANHHGRWPGENFLPIVFSTKFLYTDTWASTTAAPGYTDWVYRGNSCYDPYVGAGGASQPLGFTYMAGAGQPYQRYKVTASKIEVTVTQADDVEPLEVSVIPSLNGGALAAAYCEGNMSQPLARHAVVTNNGGPRTITHFLSTKQIFNCKDLDDQSLSAAYNADPARMWYWHISIGPPPNINIAANYHVTLKITYYTDLFDMQPLEYT